MRIRDAWLMTYSVGMMTFVEVCSSPADANEKAERWRKQHFIIGIYPIGAICK